MKVYIKKNSIIHIKLYNKTLKSTKEINIPMQKYKNIYQFSDFKDDFRDFYTF